MTTMPCLTVIQPWATLSVLGAKRVETRDWPPPPNLIGGRFAIHAASRWSEHQARFAASPPIAAALAALGWPQGKALPRGAVLGTVRLAGAVEYATLSPADWRRVAVAAMGDQDHGRWAWLIDSAEMLPAPVKTAGRQGLWQWTAPTVQEPTQRWNDLV